MKMHRSGGTVVAAFLAAFLVAVAASAAPDLVVGRIDVNPPDPPAGALVRITAAIENVGAAPVGGPILVRFAIDDREVDLVSLPTGLGVGTSAPVTGSWTAEPGAHILRVEVDPLDQVSESDETNNAELATVIVPFEPPLHASPSARSVVVARFSDESKSGFVNVDAGVADEVSQRLRDAGGRVFQRSELERILQERNLSPSSSANLLTAARALGADLLVTGSVRNVSFLQAALHLGFLRFSSASVDVRVTAEVLDTRSGEIVASAAAEGHDEGSSGFSVDLGELRSLTGSSSLCVGGLRTDRNAYAIGEAVPFGYRNSGPPGWFGVEIHSSMGGFLAWLGWQFVPTSGCGSWFWDQRDAADQQMSPGIYTAKLWNGTAYVASITFQVLPGQRPVLPPVQEITVGTAAFAQTVVGAALSRALDQLADSLLPALQSPPERAVVETADTAAETAHAGAPLRSAVVREGQIAAVLPDGRIAVNVGASAGVSVGDRFVVLGVENVVVDPITLRILDYDILETKGRIEIVEVRERVSYGQPIETFEPMIGDVVRLEQP